MSIIRNCSRVQKAWLLVSENQVKEESWGISTSSIFHLRYPHLLLCLVSPSVESCITLYRTSYLLVGWDRGFHLILTILVLQIFWRWVCQWVLAQINKLVIRWPWCSMFILFGQDWLMRLNSFVHFTKCLNGKIIWVKIVH